MTDTSPNSSISEFCSGVAVSSSLNLSLRASRKALARLEAPGR